MNSSPAVPSTKNPRADTNARSDSVRRASYDGLPVKETAARVAAVSPACLRAHAVRAALARMLRAGAYRYGVGDDAARLCGVASNWLAGDETDLATQPLSSLVEHFRAGCEGSGAGKRNHGDHDTAC